jgi:hypothetical protein
MLSPEMFQGKVAGGFGASQRGSLERPLQEVVGG